MCFQMHDIKASKACSYVYHEGIAHKGPDDVCSMLLDYLKTIPTSNEYKELHLYSDNCWGQNKNHAMSRLLLALTELKMFDKIEQFYPIRGYSFLPCDRDFGTVKKLPNCHDRMFTVEQICNLILQSSLSKKGKIAVKNMQTEEVMNFKGWWDIFYKKNPSSQETRERKSKKHEKIRYTISGYNHCTYESKSAGVTVGRPYIDSCVNHTFNFKNLGGQNCVFLVRRHIHKGKSP